MPVSDPEIQPIPDTPKNVARAVMTYRPDQEPEPDPGPD